MPDVKVEINAVTDAAERAMRRFEATAEGMFRRLVAAASVTALAAFGQKLINVQDELFKMSQRLGVTTESLSGLRGVARLANVDLGEFELFLKTAAQQLVNASDGAKEASNVFQNLRIQVRNTDGTLKSLDVLLAEVAERFADMPDGVRKTDFAVQLFGRSGQRMIPFLNEGAAGVQRLTEEMRAMGMVISTETAKNADTFNNNLTKLKMILEGLGNQVLARILPHMIEFTESLIVASTQADQLADRADKVTFVLKLLATAALATYHAFNFIAQWIATQLTVTIGVAVDLFKGLAQSIDAITSGLRKSITAWVDFGKSLGGIAPIVKKLMDKDFLGAGISSLAFWEEFKDKGERLFQRNDGEGAFAGIKRGVENATRNAQAVMNQSFDDMSTDAQKFVNRFNAIWQTPQKRTVDEPKARGSGTGPTLTVQEADALFEELFEIDNYMRERARLGIENRVAQEGLNILEREIELQRLSDDRTLAKAEKQRRLLDLLGEQNAALLSQQRILRETFTLPNLTDEERIEAQRTMLQIEQARMAILERLRELERDTFGARMGEGLTRLQDEWGRIGANLADTVIGGIEAAVRGVGDAIMGAIDGTKTWGQVFADVGRQIIASLIQVVVQWIASMTVVKLMKKIFQAEENVAAAQSAAAWGPAAVAASIASYGAAAAIGTSAALAGMTAGAVAGAALGTVSGFEKGGRVRGGRQLIQVNERGEEFVSNAAATARYGHILERMNDLALTQPAVSNASVTSGGEFGAPPAQVHIVQVYNEQDLLRVLQSKMGEQIVVTHIKNNKNEVGIQS